MSHRPALVLGPDSQGQALLEDLVASCGLSGAILPGHDAHGRPTLRIAGRPVAFSRSRARGYCALALAQEGRVGVDLVGPVQVPTELLEMHFLPAERQWLQDLPGEARLRCWAAKEAMLKALGLGLAFGLEAVELEPEGVARIAGGRAEGWNLEISQIEGFVLALAWAD